MRSLLNSFVPFVLAAAAVSGPRTVWDGVANAEQIARGKKVYNAQCARCHGETLGGGEDSPTLVGKDFLKSWNGKSVGRLVEYTREEMPSDGPGKLSRKQCIDVSAFVLNANGYPTGETELPLEIEELDKIEITPKK